MKMVIDFHRLDMIEPVEEGQLLATLEPADFGIPGIDITGHEIKPKTVKSVIIEAWQEYSFVRRRIRNVFGSIR